MGIPIRRRAFGGLLLSTCAAALGASDKCDHMEPFHWGRIKFENVRSTQDEWNAGPSGDIFFLKKLKQASGLNIDPTWYVVSLEDVDEMCKFPLLFMTSDGALELPPNQANNLKEYLMRGGFLFADDCVANGTSRVDAFFLDFRSKIEQLFGEMMVRLPNNHEIYHSFYDLPNGLPHMQGVEHGGYALFIDGRMAVFLSPSDIHCGWKDQDRKEHGINGYYAQSDNASKMGTNLFMYVMSH